MNAAARDAELEIGAPGDREIALARIIDALDHAKAVDDLRDDEVEIGVALTVDVRRLVDGESLEGELNILSVIGIETSEHQAVGDGISLGAAHEKAGRSHEKAPAVLDGGAAKRITLKREIDGATIFGAEARALGLAACAEGRLLQHHRRDGGLVLGIVGQTRVDGMPDGATRPMKIEMRELEMHGDMNAACDGLLAVARGSKLPAADGADRGLVEILIEAVLDLDVSELPFGVDGDEEYDRGVKIFILTPFGIDGRRALKKLRRSELFIVRSHRRDEADPRRD